MKNKIIIAAAGSGKTTFLVDKSLSILNKNVLIVTFTEDNAREIYTKIVSIRGFIPENITIKTWFSLLLQHGVRPYQGYLGTEFSGVDIGFTLINGKSGIKYINSKGIPVYWPESETKKYYLNDSNQIYSDKISQFVVKVNKLTKGAIIDRFSNIFDYIFVDEVQDLAGYDLEILKLFFSSASSVVLVGDPRQVTYQTHSASKYRKYGSGKIKDFIYNELGKSIFCEVDETTLNTSHRNNQIICDYSSKLYPDLSAVNSCTCSSCHESKSEHIGVFLVNPKDVDRYLSKFSPIQLRHNSKSHCNTNFPVKNLGQSKGLSFDRVLIYPTQDMIKWIIHNQPISNESTKAKLYVGLTRARLSVALVVEHKATTKLLNGLRSF